MRVKSLRSTVVPVRGAARIALGLCLGLGLVSLAACGSSQLGGPIAGDGGGAGSSRAGTDGAGTGVAGTGVAGTGVAGFAGTGFAGSGGGGTCLYNGVFYILGQQFQSFDGCNTCSCGADGSVACTDIDCRPGGCEWNSEFHVVGDRFRSPDGCNECECLKDGSVACTDQDCAQGCFMGDTLFPFGTNVVCADGCNTCYCDDANGYWSSTAIGCMPPQTADWCNEAPRPNDGLSVYPLYVAGNSLALTVRYGGGCFAHSWKLCHSGVFEPTFPLQTARVWLVDTTGANDACDAIIEEQMVFDLGPLAQTYNVTYQTGGGAIAVQVGSESVPFSF
jgi:hypothetical protein